VTVAALLATTVPAGAQVPDSVATKAGTPRVTVLDAAVVTASRSTLAVREVPVNVVVLGSSELKITATKSAPDFLRLVPGFTTRDFQSGLVAHPSRSAPGLRGIGGTSASRTLVLLDGIPINEPFSGWVHWARIPLGLVRQVEVVRGGGAGVWGDRALGGVIHFITEAPASSTLSMSIAGGSFGTTRTSATATSKQGRLGVAVAAEYLDTEGYHNVRPDLIGAIDRPSDSRDVVLFGRATYDLTPLTQVSLAASWLDDFRHGGTALKRNDTHLAEVRAGVRRVSAGGSLLTLSAYANRTGFDQYFTSEAIDRSVETPSLHQWDVPSTAAGAQLQYSRELAGHHVTLGADASAVAGDVNEDMNLSQGAWTRRRLVTGRQTVVGAWVQDALSLGGRWSLLAGARVDAWRNFDGRRVEHDLRTATVLIDTSYAATKSARSSLSFGLRHQTSRALQLRASAYSSFRAPTLNELYKPFRESGNTITEANPTLGSERLIGLDVGADLSIGSWGLARVTGFRSRLDDPILEVTVDTAGSTGRTIAPCGFVPAGGACKQRRSVDRFRTTGIEAEMEARPHRDWMLRGSYTFNPTRITRAEMQPRLVGKEGRGTSRHAGSLIVAYDNARVAAVSVVHRYAGARYDDDLNTLELSPVNVTDVRIGRQVTRQARLFVTVENLFDERYDVARATNGLVRVGGPRFVEAGMQYRW
jgi:outer membrane cobalamin receptor